MVANTLSVAFRASLLIIAGVLSSIPTTYAAETPMVPAFPGAEGYGAVTRGGKGGRVITVTNL
ncbi:MAG: hypothetical protein O3A46_04130, partial [Candidatus Poribacteria bacterium]|nr:hypothetical protein [Candidatus Poribacteria bacterium]